ncbi:MAG: PhoX family protein [Nitrospira sp.]|nr:PhoX family protein [Nitrospira sp.]
MVKLRKRMVKWGLSAAKVSLATAMLALPALPVQAEDEDSYDFGARVEQRLRNSSMHWFGIQGPLGPSAPATTGTYRTSTQKAEDQALIANSLKAEYVTRSAGNDADMFAFWPSDENPTHLIFCIEGDRQDLGVPLPAAGVNKFNPGVQSIRLSNGAVETLVRGTDACDGIRRTPWSTILFSEERSDGGAYEIINPLTVTNHTITNRILGTIIDENGLPATKVVKRTALPTMAWEGIGILPSGVLYAGDELRPGTPANADGGAMVKFVPAAPRNSDGPISNLNESPFLAGNVYALQVSCQSSSQQFGQGCEIGNGAWISVSAANVRSDANLGGATGYYRPEDLEIDEEFQGTGARFCWTDTGLATGDNYGEVICGVDSAPLTASATQRTVVVNRFVEGDPDFNQPDNFAFQPKTGNHYVIEDNPNGDIFACLPDGADRDIKTDGCVKILSVKDSTAEPTGLKFTSDGRTAFLSIQHSDDANMPKVDDYATDDIIKITGFKIPFRSQH